MSMQAINWALDTATGGPATKVLLIALANYTNEDGEAYPSIARLARETDQSQASVKRNLALLVERGFITKSARGDTESGGRLTNRYTLAGVTARSAPGGLGLAEEGVRAHPEGGFSQDHAQPRPEPKEPKEPEERLADLVGVGDVLPLVDGTAAPVGASVPPAKPKDPHLTDPEFLRFWAAYPRRNQMSKSKAWAAWKAHVICRGGPGPDRVVASAARFAAQVARERTDLKYVAHPSSWLNARPWETEDEQDGGPVVSAAQRRASTRWDMN